MKAMIMAGTLAAGMCLGSTAVMAEGVPTIAEENALVTKVLEVAEGINVPELIFNFTATSTMPDAAAVTIAPITIEDGTTPLEDTNENGLLEITETGKITFGQYKHAGEYVYTVAETAGNAEGVAYSTETYTMHVYVVNGTNGPEIRYYTVENAGGDKINNITFNNTYASENASLTIKKLIAGDYADQTKDFSFSITMDVPETSTLDELSGTIGQDSVNVDLNEGTGTATFELHNNETLTFNNLPAGTTYVVTETGTEGYTPSVEVVENGVAAIDEPTATAGQDLSSAAAGEKNLVGEGANSVVFTNTYQNITPTGIILNNLPFVILIGAAAAGFIAYVVVRRKIAR